MEIKGSHPLQLLVWSQFWPAMVLITREKHPRRGQRRKPQIARDTIGWWEEYEALQICLHTDLYDIKTILRITGILDSCLRWAMARCASGGIKVKADGEESSWCYDVGFRGSGGSMQDEGNHGPSHQNWWYRKSFLERWYCRPIVTGSRTLGPGAQVSLWRRARRRTKIRRIEDVIPQFLRGGGWSSRSSSLVLFVESLLVNSLAIFRCKEWEASKFNRLNITTTAIAPWYSCYPFSNNRGLGQQLWYHYRNEYYTGCP